MTNLIVPVLVLAGLGAYALKRKKTAKKEPGNAASTADQKKYLITELPQFTDAFHTMKPFEIQFCFDYVTLDLYNDLEAETEYLAYGNNATTLKDLQDSFGLFI